MAKAVVITMAIRFSDGNGRAFIGHQICSAGHRFGPAIRDCFLLHFVIRGKGRLQTEDGEFLLEEGEGFLIFPGEVTTYTADDEDPWEYVWVGVDATNDTENLLYRHGMEKGVHCFVYKDTADVIPYLRGLTPNRGTFNYEMAMGMFYLLVNTIVTEEHAATAKGDSYLQRCYDYMENTYADSLTVEALAEHLNISRSYLYRIFKQELGISPQRAILNFRLEKAALLMEKSRASLTEIALSCGFCDLAHFSKAYKDKYNVRPKAEKRQRQ